MSLILYSQQGEYMDKESMRTELLSTRLKKVIKRYNSIAQHQQDLIQTEMDICRCIPAGTHGSTPHLLKTIVVVKDKEIK